MYTDPDPQFLAPTRSLEVGQECPFFSMCRPGRLATLNVITFLAVLLHTTAHFLLVGYGVQHCAQCNTSRVVADWTESQLLTLHSMLCTKLLGTLCMPLWVAHSTSIYLHCWCKKKISPWLL